MSGDDCPSPVELFGQYDAHQWVRQGKVTQGPALIGPSKARRGQAIRATDKKAVVLT